MAHLAQQLGDTGVVGQVDAQHQGVDEKPDHVVQRGVAPAGDRETNGHIGIRTQGGQQHRQGGLHHHEAGGVVRPGQLGDVLLQFGRPVYLHARAEMVGDQRVGPIGGQRDAFRHPGQGSLPVLQLGGDRAVGVVEVTELRSLPQRVVGVLHRQRRPVRGPPAAPAGIRGAQVAHQRGQRPSVRGDVVDHRHQHVLVVVAPEKPCAQGDLGGQVEGVARCLVGGLRQPGRRPPRRVDDLPIDLGAFGLEHHLSGCPVGRREQGTQALVAGHHVAQGGAQRVRVQRPAQVQCDRHVVHGRRAVQLVDEPQPGLGERQRQHRRAFRGHQSPGPAGAGRDAGRQLGDGGCLEQGADGQVGVQLGVDRGDQPHGRQRVAAEFEEGIVDPYPFQSEEAGVDVGQAFLGGVLRCAVTVFGAELGGGQGAGVQLAVDRQRQRVERQHRRRQHVAGQPVGQLGADLRGVGGPGEVGDQAFVTGAVLSGDHRSLLDAVEIGERGTDFAELDAIPANLDLLVGPAHVVQLPVGTPADQVAGAVHAGAGTTERAGDKPRRRQGRAAHIAGAHPGARHIQLPRDPHRGRA